MRRRLARGTAGVCAGFLIAAACGDRTGLPALTIGAPDATIADAANADAIRADASPPGDGVRPGEASDDVTLDAFAPDSQYDLPLCQPHSAGDAGDAGRCEGLACHVPRCDAGADTIVEGYVYAPDGKLPLYGVQVYVPNAPLDPIPRGVQCWVCGDGVSGQPITSALSNATGHFTLHGVPAGRNVPLVVQLGKWRRATTIPEVAPCATTSLTDANLTRFPRSQKEGSLPHVALTTGGCDEMGCMLTKLGIDDDEFGTESDGDSKAIHVYTGSGGKGPWGSKPAMNLWGDRKNLFEYDEAIFSCECSESLGSKGRVALGGAPFQVVTDFLDAGGRIFTTDFQYTWYKYSPDPMIGETTSGSDIIGLGSIHGGAPAGASPMTLSTTLPKAVALSAWLKNIFSGKPLPSGVTHPLDSYATKNQIDPDVVWGNIQYLNSSTVTWAKSKYETMSYSGSPPPPPPASAHGLEPRIFSVGTPAGKPAKEQCGRGVHIDAHVDQDAFNHVTTAFPTSGCSKTLKADEAAFAFFFFDLASCSDVCD